MAPYSVDTVNSNSFALWLVLFEKFINIKWAFN